MLDLLGCALTLTTTLVQAIDPTPAVEPGTPATMLRPDEATEDRIRALYRRGAEIQQIVETLAVEGVRKPDGQLWTASEVEALVRTPPPRRPAPSSQSAGPPRPSPDAGWDGFFARALVGARAGAQVGAGYWWQKVGFQVAAGYDAVSLSERNGKYRDFDTLDLAGSLLVGGVWGRVRIVLELGLVVERSHDELAKTRTFIPAFVWRPAVEVLATDQLFVGVAPFASFHVLSGEAEQPSQTTGGTTTQTFSGDRFSAYPQLTVGWVF